MDNIELSEKLVTEKAYVVERISANISKVFVGKEFQVRTLLIGFISGLHVLIEDIPGVGKTTLARCLSRSVNLDFGRIQFTPDLLPGDIVGMTVWSNDKREFIFKEGAIMHQFILADELNRASPRTQSSLLEAMQEGNVTVDGKTYALLDPFFVIATQNPVSFVGSFLLPEAQVDRFGVSFSIGYLDEEHEVLMLDRFAAKNPLFELEPVAQPKDIIEIRQIVRQIHVEDSIKHYIVQLASASRQDRSIKLGLSPRSCQHLLLAAQAEALLKKRNYVIPEDVMKVAQPVLAHRLVLSAEAKIENKTPDQIITKIKQSVPIPSGVGDKAK
ncbi:MAG: AAA family ATPase [Spirochaetales bacterium]|nr:AAA family ATPase [Spirochaetales bacterium]